MLKGFRDFLARGNIVDLAVAVVIGTAFTGLVTKFTDAIIQPLINRIGAGKEASYGILQIGIGGGQTIDLNVLLSAFINFVLVAAVVYLSSAGPAAAAARLVGSALADCSPGGLHWSAPDMGAATRPRPSSSTSSAQTRRTLIWGTLVPCSSRAQVCVHGDG